MHVLQSLLPETVPSFATGRMYILTPVSEQTQCVGSGSHREAVSRLGSKLLFFLLGCSVVSVGTHRMHSYMYAYVCTCYLKVFSF